MLFEVALLAIFGFYVVVPIYEYFKDPKKLRRFPSVSVAAFTDGWMALHQYYHNRTLAVYHAHKKYGPVVRIGSNHISMATPQAIKDIYGHGTPATKDNFYAAYVGTHVNVSDAQEKAVHNVKRRRFAVAFAQKTITDLEHVVLEKLQKLILHLDSKCSLPLQSGRLPEPGELTDFKYWLGLLTYDINSVVLFSHDLGFLDSGNTIATAETVDGKIYPADVKMALRESNLIATTFAWAPRTLKLNKWLTKWHKGQSTTRSSLVDGLDNVLTCTKTGWKNGAAFRDVTIHLIRQRLKKEAEIVAAGGERLNDYFASLLWNKEREPLGLEFGEVLTEAANLLNAGAENVEIALTGTLYHLARTPRAMARLREELDTVGHAEDIPAYEEIKDLPYLRACIDENLRLRTVIGVGLPRVVPPEGMYVGGQWLEGNTTVSVCTQSVHRNPEFFHDPEEYLPDRWLEPGAANLQKVFLAFQQGGRACIGRNIAYLEMQMVVATLVRRYDFALPTPDFELKTFESISAHTGPLPVKIWRREL